jgi:hypothetical protein
MGRLGLLVWSFLPRPVVNPSSCQFGSSSLRPSGARATLPATDPPCHASLRKAHAVVRAWRAARWCVTRKPRCPFGN